MTYTFDDVLRLPLPDLVATEFYCKLCGWHRTISQPSFVYAQANADRQRTKVAIDDRLINSNYKHTLEYQLAMTNKDRAAIALERDIGVSKEKEVILNLWLQCTKDISSVEKAFLGWDKILTNDGREL